MQEHLNNPELWIKSIRWMPPQEQPAVNEELSYSDIVNLLWHGTPNGTESDACVIKIIRNSLNGTREIPKNCIETLIRDDNTTGYPLTHRLFILQVIRAVSI